jgi:hypothetical protein
VERVIGEAHECQHCGRGFVSSSSLSHHRARCKAAKVAKDDEEKNSVIGQLLENQAAQLQNQAAQLQNQAAQLKVVEKFQDQVSLLITKLHSEEPHSKTLIECEKTVFPRSTDSGGPTPRAKTTMTKTRKKKLTMEEVEEERVEIEIIPWDDHNPISVTTAQMKEAFEQNPMLQEYASLHGDEFTDPKIAPKYVSELMVDLIRRGHQNPAARNIRINPARADQVLVKAGGDWEARELSAASRSLLEAVTEAIQRTTLRDEERKQLEHEVQHALAVAGLLYCESPEQYVQSTKKPLEVHLANTISKKM